MSHPGNVKLASPQAEVLAEQEVGSQDLGTSRACEDSYTQATTYIYFHEYHEAY